MQVAPTASPILEAMFVLPLLALWQHQPQTNPNYTISNRENTNLKHHIAMDSLKGKRKN